MLKQQNPVIKYEVKIPVRITWNFWPQYVQTEFLTTIFMEYLVHSHILQKSLNFGLFFGSDPIKNKLVLYREFWQFGKFWYRVNYCCNKFNTHRG